MKKLRIMVVDDHPALREGAAVIINRDPACEVCAMAASGREAVKQIARQRPAVVVLDLHMPELDGLSVTRLIKKANPDVEVVIYTADRSEGIVEGLFQAGVKSLIRKTDEPELLLRAIKEAAEHRTFFTPQIGEIVLRLATGNRSLTELTPREREVLRLVAQGKSNREIAAELGVATRTAETHRAALMRKLEAPSTAEIVRYAIRTGVIEA